MSDHLNQITPAAALLGREVIEAKDTGEVRVRFLAKHAAEVRRTFPQAMTKNLRSGRTVSQGGTDQMMKPRLN
jgi:hypothetical protein